MSKLSGVLAYAGSKDDARAVACADVRTAVIRACLHGDKSFAVDTAKACEGMRGAKLEAVPPLMYALFDVVTALKDGTRAEVTGIHAVRVENASKAAPKKGEEAKARKARATTCHAADFVARAFAAADACALVMAGKKSVNHEDFGRAVGDLYGDVFDSLVVAMTPAKKEKAKTDTAETADTVKAETADTSTDTAETADTAKPAQAMGFAQAVRAVRHARAQTAKARAERDTARAEVARLLALIEGMQQPAAKPAKARKAV